MDLFHAKTHDRAVGDIVQTSCPPYTTALLRHFVDLREGTHHGVAARSGKELLFTKAVAFIDPHARALNVRLGISRKTVANHLAAVFNQLNLRARWQVTREIIGPSRLD
jgi:hypothetical protein